MIKQSKRSIKTLIFMVGAASFLSSLPTSALINNRINPGEAQGELLAQGSSGDSGDDGLSDQQMPSIDITEDESSPTDSNTNQLSPTNPSLENPQMTNPALRNDNIRMDDRYSTNSERLSPGSWLCLNNPNPQCDS